MTSDGVPLLIRPPHSFFVLFSAFFYDVVTELYRVFFCRFLCVDIGLRWWLVRSITFPQQCHLLASFAKKIRSHFWTGFGHLLALSSRVSQRHLTTDFKRIQSTTNHRHRSNHRHPFDSNGLGTLESSAFSFFRNVVEEERQKKNGRRAPSNGIINGQMRICYDARRRRRPMNNKWASAPATSASEALSCPRFPFFFFLLNLRWKWMAGRYFSGCRADASVVFFFIFFWRRVVFYAPQFSLIRRPPTLSPHRNEASSFCGDALYRVITEFCRVLPSFTEFLFNAHCFVSGFTKRLPDCTQ